MYIYVLYYMCNNVYSDHTYVNRCNYNSYIYSYIKLITMTNYI